MKTLIKILCLSVLWFSCESSTEPEEPINPLVGDWTMFDSVWDQTFTYKFREDGSFVYDEFDESPRSFYGDWYDFGTTIELYYSGDAPNGIELWIYNYTINSSQTELELCYASNPDNCTTYIKQ